MSRGTTTLSYRARALAQAHPLTGTARNYLNAAIDRERVSQPMPESSEWASAAALAGYCVRRVEEADAGIESFDVGAGAVAVDAGDDDLAGRVVDAAADLQAGTVERFALSPPADVLAALEHIVATDVERRLDHLRDQVDDEAWDELGTYLAWWVVQGYALRVAEVELCTAAQ